MVHTSGIQFAALTGPALFRKVQAFFVQHADHLHHFWRGGLTVIAIMLIGKVISLGWKLVIVKLGPETLGTTQLILTALTLLSSFSLFGMQTSLGRFASIAWRQHRYFQAKQLLWTSLKWCGLISLILAIGCWLGPEVTKAVLKLPGVTNQDLQYLGLAIPFAISCELAWSYLASQRRIFIYGLTRYLTLPLARLGLLIILMQTNLPVTQIIVWHLVGAVIITAGVTWFGGRLPWMSKLKPLSPGLRRRFIKYSISIGGSFLLFMVYGSTDVLLLNHFSTIEQVGLLSALLIFTELADIFFTGFLNLFQSFLSSFHKDPVTGLQFTVLTTTGLLVGGLAMTVFLTLLRTPLITFFLGAEYQLVGRFIGLALLLKTLESSIVFSLHHYLDFYGYVKITIGLMAAGLLIKLLAGWWLIAQYTLAGVFYTQAVVIVFQVVCCTAIIGTIVLTRNNHFTRWQRWLKLD